MHEKVQKLINSSPVLVIGTSTCPFCIEAKRILASYNVRGTFVDMDKEASLADMWKEMTSYAGNSTSVPQIWINKKHVGGCDDLKTLDVKGDLELQLSGIPRQMTVEDAEAGPPVVKKPAGLSVDSAVAIYPGPKSAFHAPFHFPATVDHRVVRLYSVITFCIAFFTALFARRDTTEWVVFGLLMEFVLSFTGFPSPVGLIAALPFVGTKPNLSAGAPQQLSHLCGMMFSAVGWTFLVLNQSMVARVVLAMLAGVAFVQGVLNFSVCSFGFDYLVKWSLVSKSVYRLHVHTKANLVHASEKPSPSTVSSMPLKAVRHPIREGAAYAWETNTISTAKGVSPKSVRYPTKGLPSNPTDLRAKPAKGKANPPRFHLIKYCHINYFMVPLSILGLSTPWAILTQLIGIGHGVWEPLAWLGVGLNVILWPLYIAKCFIYPKKVKKEWGHPIRHNFFALPFLNLILMAWLVARWSMAEGSELLGRVLFLLGTVPLSSMTIFTIAGWVSIPVDEELINPNWMLMPVGNLLGAVAARHVDPDYVEFGWFLFSIGALVWLALWPTTFRKAVIDHHSDFALRNFYGLWVAPPAVAMLAYSSLEDLNTFGPLQRVFFYASLTMALVLGIAAWPMNFFLEGKFVMSAWAFTFPLDAFAGAAVTVYSYTHGHMMEVIYMVALTAASLVNAVNMLSTLALLKQKKLFIPGGKWSPLSFVQLTHQAFRIAMPKLQKLAAAASPAVEDASALRELGVAWTSLCKAHDIHTMHEETIIFPALERYFPGQTHVASVAHEIEQQSKKKVQTAMDTLLNGDNYSIGEDARLELFRDFKANLSKFGNELVEHMDNEENAFVAPIIRKYVPVQAAKYLARSSWDATSHEDMSELLGWVMATLRAPEQKTRFLRTWIWAMPERAQQLGLMVYRVVDDVTWIQAARDLPEMVPRGLPGHRRYG